MLAAMPSRVLLAAHPTVGHTNALRAIGRVLLGRGHAVGFAISGARLPLLRWLPEPLRAALELPAQIERDGFTLLPLRPPLGSLWVAAKLPRARGQEELALALALFTAGLASGARAIEAHARAFAADVVVADYLLPAAWLAAQRASLPFVTLYHSALPFAGRGHAPFGSDLDDDAPRDAGWRAAERRLEELLASYDERLFAACDVLGLPRPARGGMTQPYSQDLNLLATVPELEPGLLPLEGPVTMVGPCLPAARSADDDDPAIVAARAASGRTRVYVSLGTVFNAQPRVFDAILAAFDPDRFSVIVSAGASYEVLRARGSPHVSVFRRVPQVPLLHEVDLVITHGGNNTVQETLSAGRPMVVVPFGGDQRANALRVRRLGVGATVSADQLGSALPAAIERALAPEARARASAIGAAMAGHDGATRAADEIERLLQARSART